MLFDRLVAAYEDEGFLIRSSISHFMLTTITVNPAEDGALTHVGKEGADWLVEPGDMAMSDLCFLEALCRARPARRALVLGGGFGWNALAVALANPGARTLLLADPAGKGAAGLALAASLGRRRGVALTARAGGPREVGAACAAELGGAPDLVLLDSAPPGGLEEACATALAAADPDAVLVVHGVVSAGILDRFRAIAASLPGRMAAVLSRTTSGMGVLAPATLAPGALRALRGFDDPFASVRV